MKPTFHVPSGKYVVAVSGGIDSVVLLDLIRKQPDVSIVVAHMNHGIRPDEQSRGDALYVESLADKWGLPFAVVNADLGPNTSEEQARDARYAFLSRVKKYHTADSIVTAHHADDIVETIILNLARGTGWRGLSSLRSHKELLRPMLNWRKSDIARYAIDNGLYWRDDSTNDDIKYSRNYVRHGSMHKLQPHVNNILMLHAKQSLIAREIHQELKMLGDKLFSRYFYVMSPDEVAEEALYFIVEQKSQKKITRPQRARLLHFVRTAANDKIIHIAKGLTVRVTKTQIMIVPATSD